ASYEWDFGDGLGASSDKFAEYSYAKIGTYTVTLTVRDAAGNSNSITHDVVVGDKEKPAISGLGERRGTTGDPVFVPVTVTDNKLVATVTLHYSQDGNSYSTSTVAGASNWSGILTFIANINSVTPIIYWVVASDDSYNTTTSEKWFISITDNDVPTPQFTYMPPQPKQNQMITFDASSSTDNIGVVNYTWGFGDGATATGRVTKHSYSAIGTYTITLIVEDEAGNNNLTTQNVRVVDNETPVISGLTDLAGTTGDPVNVPVTVTDNKKVATVTLCYNQGGINYSTYTVTDAQSWNGVLSFIASNTTDKDITYWIVASDDDYNSSESEKYTIFITDDENPNATFIYNPASPEQNQVVTFDASNSTDNIGIVIYNWSFGDGEEVSKTNDKCTHKYTERGTYVVELVIKDNAGNKASTQTTITVIDVQIPIARIKCGDRKVEANIPVTFDGSESSDNGTIVNYIWEFGDGLGSTTQNSTITHTYVNPGVYKVGLNVVDDAKNTSTVTAYVQITVTYNQITVTQTIGSNGGTIGTTGVVTVEIPKNALSGNVNFTIEPTALGNIPNGFIAIAGVTYKITPKKLFDKECTLTIWYADADQNGIVDDCDINNLHIPSINETDLRIYYYDGYDWIMLQSEVNAVLNNVTAKISHLAKFTLGVKGQGPSSKDVDPETILDNLVLTENPFAPTGGNFTEFQGDLGRDSYITIKIYDTIGEEVRELLKNLVTAGASRTLAIWDGKTNGGEIVENGIYVYQIKVEQVGGGTKVETHAIGIVK
ncbi:MAG: PKD domain-containing protein, partial [bacterium]